MKLRAVFRYQILDFLKPVAIYFTIVYAFVGFAVGFSVVKGTDSVIAGAMETNTLVFLAICVPLAFHENFRFFMQNGITRKALFGSTVTQFAVVSLIMGLIDTALPTIFERISPYRGLFMNIYGGQNLLAHFAWITSAYFAVCMVAYALTALYHRIGQKWFLSGGVLLAVVLIPLFAIAVRAGGLLEGAARVFTQAMGFTSDGVRLLFPVCTFLAVCAVAALGAFALIRRAQVK